MTKPTYVLIDESQVPEGVLFATDLAFQGRMIEHAYGEPGRRTPGPGDLYKRVTDRSTGGGTRYYRRVD